ncbi:MAG: glutamine--tRNA ligase, partial [Spirochaetales bacterium]|nr:glutamine--tRNA ligase [Spirochaetales bacterium]
YFRLSPGKEIRLKHAYYVKCVDYKTDSDGNVTEVHCTYDPATKGGWSDDGRMVKGTSHWVSAAKCIDTEVRLYENLFAKENPDEVEEGHDFTENLNPNSLKVITAKSEPSLAEVKPGEHFQFLRQGYFVADDDYTAAKPVFNKAVALKDSWKPNK